MAHSGEDRSWAFVAPTTLNLPSGMEHYQEKVRNYLNRYLGKGMISKDEFGIIFNDFEKEYFNGLPKSVFILTNMSIPSNNRLEQLFLAYTTD